MTLRSAPALTLVAILLSPPLSSRAQEHVETIAIDVPPLPRPEHFVIVRPMPAALREVDVPSAARSLLLHYLDTSHARRARFRRPDFRDHHRENDDAIEHEMRAGVALRVALQHEPSLGREALLGLGVLLHYEEEARWEAAGDAVEARRRVHPEDCVDPILNDQPAMAYWAQIEGDDALAAEALFQRAWSLWRMGSADQARDMFERVLTMPALAPETEAHAAFDLGSFDENADSARAAFARAASLGTESIHASAALRAAEFDMHAGRFVEAAMMLAPHLAQADLGEVIRRLAGFSVARLGDHADDLSRYGANEALPVLLRLGAETLRAEGNFAWAECDASLATMSARRARGCTFSRREDAIESPQAFITRAVTHCAQASRVLPDPGLVLVMRVDAHGRPSLRARNPEASLAPLVQCLERHAPPAHVEGAAVRFQIRLAPHAE